MPTSGGKDFDFRLRRRVLISRFSWCPGDFTGLTGLTVLGRLQHVDHDADSSHVDGGADLYGSIASAASPSTSALGCILLCCRHAVTTEAVAFLLETEQ
ncbi:Catenin delta-1 [Frankliniella fusca]|uniref:Catenin delta-1 n=1 Tax=Frankliniella fusca TaxID=407009 RepID=A0AAE1LPI0_9NEOP|nr:Catenin delta-1 [Frankliniella fusca]